MIIILTTVTHHDRIYCDIAKQCYSISMIYPLTHSNTMVYTKSSNAVLALVVRQSLYPTTASIIKYAFI